MEKREDSIEEEKKKMMSMEKDIMKKLALIYTANYVCGTLILGYTLISDPWLARTSIGVLLILAFLIGGAALYLVWRLVVVYKSPRRKEWLLILLPTSKRTHVEEYPGSTEVNTFEVKP